MLSRGKARRNRRPCQHLPLDRWPRVGGRLITDFQNVLKCKHQALFSAQGACPSADDVDDLVVSLSFSPPGGSESEGPLSRGITIGRYVVLALVGRGGMGEVYAGYDPELDRRVAIKLMRVRNGHADPTDQASLDSGRKRVLREAQAIAKLSHPNVVVIHDVGSFRDQVFIAMEFVEGQTVRSWLNLQARSWADILKVLVAAGRGLAAAHDKKLIHRDLKPDNVMVTADGQVRVMDFGLARLAGDRSSLCASDQDVGAARLPRNLDPAAVTVVGQPRALALGPALATDASTKVLGQCLTQTGSLIGTPAYMGPEQLLAGATDARTDQFSFCVTLYEALYGERPFEGSTLADLTANVIQGQVGPAMSGTDVPAWLRRVVLRGLNVDPDQRWPSMHALLAEVERNLAVAGRHRFAVRAAAKLAGIWEAPTRQRSALTASKAAIKQAFLATNKHYAASTFDKVGGILDRYATAWAEMYVSACEATHTHGDQSAEVLDLRMAALEDALQVLRALCDAFRSATPEVIENAVDAASSLPSIERCADVALLRAVIKPPEDPQVRATVDRLRTRLSEVRATARVGRLTEALKAMAPLEDDVRTTGYGPLLAETLLERGWVHSERREIEAAGRSYEEALWTAERIGYQEVVAEAATQLVSMTAYQFRFDVGEVWAKFADAVLGRLGGHDRLVGWLYNNIGQMRQMQGRLAEAVEFTEHAIAVKEKNLGGDNPDLGISIGNLACLLGELGDQMQAAVQGERALEILEATLGPEHPRTAIYLANHSEALYHLGRFSEARAVGQRALVIHERETESDGVVVTAALTALALAHLDDGLVDQALPLLERAVKNREAREAAAPVRLGEVHFALARALGQATGGDDRARALAARARDEYRRGIPTPATARALAAIDVWLAAHDASSG
ncbi:MAG TPA: serine/threonine-protein kinase [Polyangia bacterium]|nr:serine/threonine-protein kinase [Polyangia bacterium]